MFDKYAANLVSTQQALERIQPLISSTPTLTSKTLDTMAGKRLLFKLESSQKTGSYKFRGASNAIFSLNEKEISKGVVTYTSGNHGAALALAAQKRGVPAYVVISSDTPQFKVQNIIRYGGQIIWSEPTLQSMQTTAAKVKKETGAVFIETANDGRIISGHGTMALELLEHFPEVDTLIAPIGVSGLAVAAKTINPAIRVFAAEPAGANDAALSKASGDMVTLPHVTTIADGLKGFLGDKTWPIVRDYVDAVITVDDAEIIRALKLSLEVLKVVVEPSGAVGLAAALSKNFKEHELSKDRQNIAIVFSGGNIDFEALWRTLGNH